MVRGLFLLTERILSSASYDLWKRPSCSVGVQDSRFRPEDGCQPVCDGMIELLHVESHRLTAPSVVGCEALFKIIFEPKCKNLEF